MKIVDFWGITKWKSKYNIEGWEESVRVDGSEPERTFFNKRNESIELWIDDRKYLESIGDDEYIKKYPNGKWFVVICNGETGKCKVKPFGTEKDAYSYAIKYMNKNKIVKGI